jgi:hypothetical protein
MSGETVEFHGEKYRIADQIGLMPLMRFAKVAQAGVDSSDMDGLVAMYDLMEQCLVDEDWARFAAAATKHRADGEELMDVVRQAIEAMAERPTQRSSDSSDGPPSTSGNSTGDSSSQVVRRLERQGRPDLALLVRRTEADRTARAS